MPRPVVQEETNMSEQSKPAGDGPAAPAKPAEKSPATTEKPAEIGGPKGPEPTRYNDWERGGRCIDF